jgi:hypothetical protein
MTSSGIEYATFRLVELYFNELRYRMRLYSYKISMQILLLLRYFPALCLQVTLCCLLFVKSLL